MRNFSEDFFLFVLCVCFMHKAIRMYLKNRKRLIKTTIIVNKRYHVSYYGQTSHMSRHNFVRQWKRWKMILLFSSEIKPPFDTIDVRWANIYSLLLFHSEPRSNNKLPQKKNKYYNANELFSFRQVAVA